MDGNAGQLSEMRYPGALVGNPYADHRARRSPMTAAVDEATQAANGLHPGRAQRVGSQQSPALFNKAGSFIVRYGRLKPPSYTAISTFFRSL
jgi:hypothetical protein